MLGLRQSRIRLSLTKRTMEIKLKKQIVKNVYRGLGDDMFIVLQKEEMVIDIGSAGYIEENSIPTELEIISDWESRTETIKVNSMEELKCLKL